MLETVVLSNPKQNIRQELAQVEPLALDRVRTARCEEPSGRTPISMIGSAPTSAKRAFQVSMMSSGMGESRGMAKYCPWALHPKGERQNVKSRRLNESTSPSNSFYRCHPATEVLMSLTPCPACGREISTEARSCPQCGHPQGETATAPVGSKCYACTAPATTRCEQCQAPSCAQHLQGIHVGIGEKKRYQLRCQQCYSEAKANEALLPWFFVFGCIFFIAVIVFILGLRFGWFWGPV
jgi:hypothetical protein